MAVRGFIPLIFLICTACALWEPVSGGGVVINHSDMNQACDYHVATTVSYNCGCIIFPWFCQWLSITCSTTVYHRKSGNFYCYGSTAVQNNQLALTTDGTGQRGVAWSRTKPYVRDGFVAEFDFKLEWNNYITYDHRKGYGADGLAFVVQNQGACASGGGGSEMGYTGIRKSFATEFDTWQWQSYESSANHVAFHSAGLGANSFKNSQRLAYKDLSYALKGQGSNAKVWKAQVTYNPSNNNKWSLSLWRNGVQVCDSCLTTNYNIDGLLDSQGRAYVGFTAATGATTENHLVYNFKLTTISPAKAELSEVVMSPTTITAGESTTITVKMKNSQGYTGSTGDVITASAESKSKTATLLSSGVYEIKDFKPTTDAKAVNVVIDVNGHQFQETLTINPGALDEKMSTVSYSTTSITLPTQTLVATVQERDGFGNARTTTSSSATVTITGNGVKSMSTPSASGGTWTTTLTMATEAASYTVNARINGDMNPDYKSKSITVAAGPASSLEITAKDGVVSNVADGSNAVTAVVRDAYGNDVSDSVSIQLSVQGSSTPTYHPTDGKFAAANAGSRTAYWAATKAGQYTVTVTAGTLTSKNAVVTLAPGAHSPSHSLMSKSVVTGEAGTQHVYTIQMRDAFSNNLEAGAATGIFTGSVTGTASPVVSETVSGPSKVQLSFTPEKEGSYQVSASPVPSYETGVTSLNVFPSATSKVATLSDPYTHTASKTAFSFEFYAMDRYDNVQDHNDDGFTVVMQHTGSSEFVVADSVSAKAGSPGYYTVSKVITKAGTYTIKIILNDSELKTASLTVTHSTADASNTKVSNPEVFSATQTKGQAFDVYVEAKDAYGNAVPEVQYNTGDCTDYEGNKYSCDVSIDWEDTNTKLKGKVNITPQESIPQGQVGLLYKISINMNGNAINQSPFPFFVGTPKSVREHCSHTLSTSTVVAGASTAYSITARTDASTENVHSANEDLFIVKATHSDNTVLSFFPSASAATWSGDVSFTKAGTWTLTVLLGGGVVGDTVTYNVNPADADPYESYMYSTSNPGAVSDSIGGTIYVKVFDKYNNERTSNDVVKVTAQQVTGGSESATNTLTYSTDAYTTQFTLSVAGVYKMISTVSVGGVDTSIGPSPNVPITLYGVVTPGATDASKCTLLSSFPTESSQEAGQKLFVHVKTYDSNNNARYTNAAETPVLKVGHADTWNNGAGGESTSLTSNGDGSYSGVSAAMTKKGTYKAAVYLGSTLMSKVVISDITIVPSPADETKCVYSEGGLSSSVAGTEATFTYIVKDEHSNLVDITANKMFALATVTYEENSLVVSMPVTRTYSADEAKLSFKVTPKRAVEHTMTLYLDSKPVKVTKFTPSAGAIDPAKCELSQADDAKVSSDVDSTFFYMQCYDEFGNAKFQSDANVEVSSNLSVQKSTENSLYKFTYNPTSVGTHDISIKVASVNIKQYPLSITVTPGAIASTSTVSDLPSSLVAGEWAQSTVVAKDKNGNSIHVGGESSEITWTMSDDSKDEFTVTDLKSGTYLVDWRVKTVGSRTVTGKIGTTVVATKAVDVACGELGPTGSDVSGSGVAHAIAGVPAFVDITTNDEFGNLFTRDVLVNMTIYGNPDGDNIVFEGFTGNVTAGSSPGTYQAQYVPNAGGNFTVGVAVDGDDIGDTPVMINIEHFKCAANDPTKKYRCADRYDVCVDSYTNCPASPQVCTNSFWNHETKQCSDTCPDSTYSHRCESSGACVKAANKDLQCPSVSTGCDGGRECWSKLTCPPGYVRCNDGARCVQDKALCLVNQETEPECSGLTPYRCADGRCATTFDDCGTPILCPSGKVRCPDGSCRSNAAECPEARMCFSYTPYYCGDNTCAPTKEDCPTVVSCPTNYIKCPNGECKLTYAECMNIAHINGTCADTQVRCSDGSCAANYLACPTETTCPSTMVRCPDGSCAYGAARCRMPVSCPKGLFRCPSGSCTKNADSCPPGVSCPSKSPVLCSDGSCVPDLSQCPTPLICSGSRPHRCPDGSCQQAIEDCSPRRSCPAEFPVQCTDGTCVETADTCNGDGAMRCPTGQVRCPSGHCAHAYSMCPTSAVCPMGNIMCPDGACVADFSSCVINVGSRDLCRDPEPVRCPDNSCASSLKECPVDVVCPSDRPVRCTDQSCVARADLCVAPMECPEGYIKCADGTCVYAGPEVTPGDSSTLCRTPLSCPVQSSDITKMAPFKCYDSSCVQHPKDCPSSKPCPADNPFLCPGGTCAKGRYACPNVGGLCNERDANGNAKSIYCVTADEMKATCVTSNDQCVKDTSYGCPLAKIRCWDGSCHVHEEECPAKPTDLVESQQCPSNQIKCPDGACMYSHAYCLSGFFHQECKDQGMFSCCDGTCVAKAGQCPPTQPGNCKSHSGAIDSRSPVTGCPHGTQHKCEKTGLCVSDSSTCDTQGSVVLVSSNNKKRYANGCNEDAPYKCADGSCIADSTKCNSVSGCPWDSPVRCPDGTCVSTANIGTCSTGTEANGCQSATPIRCPSGACVAEAKGCTLVNGCPVSSPIRCNDGSCKLYSRGTNSTESCLPIPVCPSDAPHLCADNTCVGHPIMCKALDSCPSAAPYRCDDLSCVSDGSKCPPLTCPSDLPVLCPNGKCGASPIDCKEVSKCEAQGKFDCVDDQCYDSPAACVAAVEDFIPCRETRCPDGSCESSFELCDALPSCGMFEQRCSDGSCKSCSEACTGAGACTDSSMTRCADGVCRSSCPQYEDACPTNQRCLCPDGSCRNATAIAECSDPLCPAGQFRCASNYRECVSDTSQCSKHPVQYRVSSVDVTVDPSDVMEMPLVSDDDGQSLVALEVPVGAFGISSSSSMVNLAVRPVARSRIENAKIHVDSTRVQDLTFLRENDKSSLTGSEGIASPVIDLTVDDFISQPFAEPVKLSFYGVSLESLAVNGSDTSIMTSDLCLGFLNTTTSADGVWECVHRFTTQETTGEYVGYTTHFSTFAVILSPSETSDVDTSGSSGDTLGFWEKYSLAVILISISLACVFACCTYLVFQVTSCAVYFYRSKVKRTKEVLQAHEYAEEILTNVKVDAEAVHFSANPLYGGYGEKDDVELTTLYDQPNAAAIAAGVTVGPSTSVSKPSLFSKVNEDEKKSKLLDEKVSSEKTRKKRGDSGSTATLSTVSSRPVYRPPVDDGFGTSPGDTSWLPPKSAADSVPKPSVLNRGIYRPSGTPAEPSVLSSTATSGKGLLSSIAASESPLGGAREKAVSVSKSEAPTEASSNPSSRRTRGDSAAPRELPF